MSSHAWIDASAGIAGDMLLGALLDAGASLERVQEAVRAVAGAAVRVDAEQTTRAGLRCTRAVVELLDDDPPHRTLATVARMLAEAGLDDAVRDRAEQVFAVLADAEGRVHGVEPASVEFHEVGALDSIADIVGVSAALHDLGIETLSAGTIALGSGQVTGAHGILPVPVPAVLELSRGWRVEAGGSGELTTPTGMALLAALADCSADLPPMAVASTGAGAGARDTPGRANVTRVVVGTVTAARAADPGTPAVVLEANVDDMDPQLWPGVISALLAAGADDAWLTPIVMKKGRPAHALSVLCSPHRAAELTAEILTRTSTFGVRRSAWTKHALPRTWASVDVLGVPVRVKLAHADGRIVRASVEFDDVASLAVGQGVPETDVLARAQAAAAAAGLVPGAPVRIAHT